MESPFQTFTARLVHSISSSEFTRHLEFEIVEKTCLAFVAGQWLSFRQSKPDGERSDSRLFHLLAAGG